MCVSVSVHLNGGGGGMRRCWTRISLYVCRTITQNTKRKNEHLNLARLRVLHFASFTLHFAIVCLTCSFLPSGQLCPVSTTQTWLDLDLFVSSLSFQVCFLFCFCLKSVTCNCSSSRSKSNKRNTGENSPALEYLPLPAESFRMHFLAPGKKNSYRKVGTFPVSYFLSKYLVTISFFFFSLYIRSPRKPIYMSTCILHSEKENKTGLEYSTV